MARCCGSTGSCACKIEAGRNIQIEGMGSSQDAFVISADVALGVDDSPTIDLGLAGAGSLVSPWILSARLSDEASLADFSDVTITGPIPNGYTLLWSETEQAFMVGPPTTADPGAVSHDTSLNGDGSSGTPLAVRSDAARYLTTTSAGVGLNPTAVNGLVRVYASAAARTTAIPTPTVGAVTQVSSTLGRLDYWDGDEWLPITNGLKVAAQAGQLAAFSGSYAGGPTTDYIDQISVDTDVDGTFEVISALDLTGYAGVLDVQIQPLGAVPWQAMLLTPTGGRVTAKAYRLTTGAPYASVPITASVRALLY